MSAVSFYKGCITHQRLDGLRHRFAYKLAYVLVDLDAIDEAHAQSSILSIGRGGVMSVLARDHGDRTSPDLAQWVRRFLTQQGVDQQASTIKLLTMPRMFGYVFNPISVYFIFDADQNLHHVLYEVNNTFGDRHFYLCATDGGDRRHHHSCDKEFYVSPFFDVEGAYQFCVHAPEEKVALTIDYQKREDQPAMTAHLTAERVAVTNMSAALILAQFPFMTLGVMAAIHWQALKLMIKGARFRQYEETNRSATVTRGKREAFPTPPNKNTEAA